MGKREKAREDPNSDTNSWFWVSRRTRNVLGPYEDGVLGLGWEGRAKVRQERPVCIQVAGGGTRQSSSAGYSTCQGPEVGRIATPLCGQRGREEPEQAGRTTGTVRSSGVFSLTSHGQPLRNFKQDQNMGGGGGLGYCHNEI